MKVLSRDETSVDLSKKPNAEMRSLAYQSGFGNEFASEALPGALPLRRNAPQRVPYGLYAEQLSGTPFMMPRDANRRSWLYRIRPSVMHRPFRLEADGGNLTNVYVTPASPNQMRWDPTPTPNAPTDFVEGLITLAGNGSPTEQTGCAIFLYAANRSMVKSFFSNTDGELLIIPQKGRICLLTELGILLVAPGECAVLPRGMRMRVELPDGDASGYACENHGAPFRLPDLGPIGANGLANARDFLVPDACFEEAEGNFKLIQKYAGHLWTAAIEHSPLDVVAWHGNYVPYKYDLQTFNAMGSITYDHPDPSIFVALQSPTEIPGADAIDLLVVPPRWLPMEDTFRPAYFHRNVASEFMGLIWGEHDTKAHGFVPGGSSLHNSMQAHGPDAESFEKGLSVDTSKPQKMSNTLAFMIETRVPLLPTRFAIETQLLQTNYHDNWLALKPHFTKQRQSASS